MIGLDTNVLLRYITQDDPLQAATAASILERRSSADPGFVSLVVIMELVWVLRSFYEFADPQIAAALRPMLLMPALQVQNERQVFTALSIFESGAASFSDALIGALGAWAGCSTTLTFDRKAARLQNFKLA